MIRKIIHIDESKCNGCGACAAACHEGAIQMVDGVAKLTREDYCDGLGDCLPACPTGAITFEMREMAKTLRPAAAPAAAPVAQGESVSQLSQWPVQIKLVNPMAPYFQGCRLLVAADCTAYAYANFHQRFIRGHVTLVGCPKLDSVDYSEKLTEILMRNDVKSVTVVRMEVPCCGGIELAVKKALQASGKMIPWQVVTIGTNGTILDEL